MDRIERNRKRRAKFLLKKLRNKPQDVLRNREYWNPNFCRIFLEHCDEQTFENPKRRSLYAQLGVRLAMRTKDLCLITRAQSVLGSNHRARNNVNKAEKCYSLCSSHADECPVCQADLKRRQAYLQLYQGDTATAIALATAAIDISTSLGDFDAAGRAMVIRGIANWVNKRFDLALRDNEDALERVTAEDSYIYFCSTLHNLTTVLASDPSFDTKAIFQHLQEVRHQFKGLPRVSVQRAKLRWTEGLVLNRDGKIYRAEMKLKSARDRLLRLELPNEATAAAADIARINYPNRVPIVAVCRHLLSLSQLEGKITVLIKKVLAAAEERHPKLLDRIKKLRNLVSGHSAPVFVPRRE